MGDRKNKLYGYANGSTLSLFMCADTNMKSAVAFKCESDEPGFQARVIPVLSKDEVKELIEQLKELYERMD